MHSGIVHHAGPHSPDPGTRSVVEVDPETRRAYLNGTRLTLTATEFDILNVLHSRAEKVVTYEDLAELVWGVKYFVEKRSIEVQMSRLRAKLGESGAHPHLIHTVRGVGFRFSTDETNNVIASFAWDEELTLVKMQIFDDSFFDVRPEDVPGTHYVVPANQWFDLPLVTRIAWVRQLFDMGMYHWDGPFDLQGPEGLSTVTEQCTWLFSLDGEFAGVGTDFRLL